MNKKINKRYLRKSMRGVWGHTGAPPKDIKWPNGIFTYKRLFAVNVDTEGKNHNKVCALTCRSKVEEKIINQPDGSTNQTGEIYQLMSRKQPYGRVGRPIDLFIKKDQFDPAVMTLKPVKPFVPVAATIIREPFNVEKAKEYVANLDLTPATPTADTTPVALEVPKVG